MPKEKEALHILGNGVTVAAFSSLLYHPCMVRRELREGKARRHAEVINGPAVCRRKGRERMASKAVRRKLVWFGFLGSLVSKDGRSYIS